MKFFVYVFQPTQVPSRLQLVPTSYSEVRPKSASKSRSISRASRALYLARYYCFVFKIIHSFFHILMKFFVYVFQPTQVPSRLQLVPTSYSEVRPKSASKSRSISRASRASRASSIYSRPDSIRTAPPGPESLVVYPETFECDDLSYLPPPKRILPKRDVPWVFRYKVKRNMNELSKIMASKPAPMIDV